MDKYAGPHIDVGGACELRHMSELPEIFGRFDFDMSVCCGIVLLNQTKGALMCNICYAQEFGISMISASPETMCETHYFEWAEEKTYNDFDRSTEGLYL